MGRVGVGNRVGVGVGTSVGVGVGTRTGVGVGNGTAVGTSVGKGVGCRVGVGTAVAVGSGVGVGGGAFTVRAKGLRASTCALASSVVKSAVVSSSSHPVSPPWCSITIREGSFPDKAMVDSSSTTDTSTGVSKVKSSTTPVPSLLSDLSLIHI